MSGPIRAKGSSPDLEVATSLQGAAGAFSFDGRLDIDSVGGYGAQRARTVQRAEHQPSPRDGRAFQTATISGHYDVDLTGETVNTIRGTAGVALERTTVDSIRVYPSEAHLRFADGRMMVDSLQLHTSAATLAVLAGGGIGLPNGRPDSLRFTLLVDSLGGLRRYLSHPDTTLLGARATPPDSLAGGFTVHGRGQRNARCASDQRPPDGEQSLSQPGIRRGGGRYLRRTRSLRRTLGRRRSPR